MKKYSAEEAKPTIPNYKPCSQKKGRKFEKGRLPDGTGWVVKRVA